MTPKKPHPLIFIMRVMNRTHRHILPCTISCLHHHCPAVTPCFPVPTNFPSVIMRQLQVEKKKYTMTILVNPPLYHRLVPIIYMSQRTLTLVKRKKMKT
eukprot:scaffold21252_cov29-Attheya_sp.AAC.1